MLILLDHSTPAPLRHALKGHVIVEAVERGWERLVNGALLEAMPQFRAAMWSWKFHYGNAATSAYATIKNVQFPLSQDEHAAMARYLSSIKKQLQEVSDLFKSRYGKGSEISESAVRTLSLAASLENDFSRLHAAAGSLIGAGKAFNSRNN